MGRYERVSDLDIHSPSAGTHHHLLLAVQHHRGPARQGVVHEDGVGVREGFVAICVTFGVYVRNNDLIISDVM